MQPANPLLDAYRNLTGTVIANVDPILGATRSPYLVNQSQPNTGLPSSVTNFWGPVPSSITAIDETLRNLGETIFQIITDQRFTSDAKNQMLREAATAARSTITATTTDILDRVNQILDRGREAAYPSRPTPVDALQEATIAGIKGDLRMLWDSAAADIIGPDGLVNLMIDSLSRAIGDRDGLTIWLLASSRWPEDYIRSRRIPDAIPSYQSLVDSTLDGLAPDDDLALTRRSYSIIADARSGLPALQIAFAQLTPIIDDTASWRPTSWSPFPPTRTA